MGYARGRRGIRFCERVWQWCLTNCIHYLLLCKKLPPPLKLSNLKQQMFNLRFWGSEIQEWCSWVDLLQGFSQGCSQAVGWVCSHLKAWLGLKNVLWRSFMWPLAGGFSSQMLTTWQMPSPRANSPRGDRECAHMTKMDVVVSYNLNLEVTDHHFSYILLVPLTTYYWYHWQPWYPVSGEYTRVWIPRNRHH